MVLDFIVGAISGLLGSVGVCMALFGTYVVYHGMVDLQASGDGEEESS